MSAWAAQSLRAQIWLAIERAGKPVGVPEIAREIDASRDKAVTRSNLAWQLSRMRVDGWVTRTGDARHFVYVVNRDMGVPPIQDSMAVVLGRWAMDEIIDVPGGVSEYALASALHCALGNLRTALAPHLAAGRIRPIDIPAAHGGGRGYQAQIVPVPIERGAVPPMHVLRVMQEIDMDAIYHGTAARDGRITVNPDHNLFRLTVDGRLQLGGDIGTSIWLNARTTRSLLVWLESRGIANLIAHLPEPTTSQGRAA